MPHGSGRSRRRQASAARAARPRGAPTSLDVLGRIGTEKQGQSNRSRPIWPMAGQWAGERHLGRKGRPRKAKDDSGGTIDPDGRMVLFLAIGVTAVENLG